jgi:hypothetical protein
MLQTAARLYRNVTSQFALPRYLTIGGKVDRTRASFRISGDTLDPERITARLGLQPTRAFAKGDLSPPGRVTGRKYRRRVGLWSLQSPLPTTASLDDHLSHLLDQLDPHADAVGALVREGYQADFFCGCFLEAFNRGMELPATTLRRIAALEATLGLDIYCDCDPPTLVDVVNAWWWTLHGRWRRRRSARRRLWR